MRAYFFLLLYKDFGYLSSHSYLRQAGRYNPRSVIDPELTAISPRDVTSTTADAVLEVKTKTAVIAQDISAVRPDLHAVAQDTAIIRPNIQAIAQDTAVIRSGIQAVEQDGVVIRSGVQAIAQDTQAIQSSLQAIEVKAARMEDSNLVSNSHLLASVEQSREAVLRVERDLSEVPRQQSNELLRVESNIIKVFEEQTRQIIQGLESLVQRGEHVSLRLNASISDLDK